MASLAASFGRGAMTNHWRDFKNSDVILVIGANPAENHPCGWKWAHVGRDERGTKIIHVDPRFTRTSAIADLYAPIRAGTDVAFFGGLINYILEKKLYHEDYVKLHTNAAFIVAEDFKFDDGLFSGYDEAKRAYDPTTWDYERAGDRQRRRRRAARASPGTRRWGRLRRSAGRPTPRPTRPCGPPLRLPAHEGPLRPLHAGEGLGDHRHAGGEVHQDRRVVRLHRTPDKVGNIVYAVGLTHHTTGVQIIRGIGLVQMLLGNIGRPGGGVNAERGHANIQGNTDNAISWEILPGYLAIPRPGMDTMADYLAKVPSKPPPDAVNYFGTNYKKFIVGCSSRGTATPPSPTTTSATPGMPKPGKNSSWLTIHDEARSGRPSTGCSPAACRA